MSPNRNFVRAISHHGSHTPDKTAVAFISGASTEIVTYGDLNARARSFAQFFANSGLPEKSVIFIVLKHKRELFDTFIGAMMAGFIPSFLPYATPKQDPVKYWEAHAALFARVDPSMIVTYADNLEPISGALAQDSATAVVAVEEIDLSPADHFICADDADDAVALLQHSSGTTGLKKGVMLSHAQVRLQVASYSDSFDFDASCIVASWLPLYHDMGLFSSFLMPIMLGSTIVALDPFEWVGKPVQLLDAIHDYKATHCWMPNFAFSHLRRYVEMTKTPVPDLSSLRAAISCSEPVRGDTVAQFREFFAPYGLAATAPQACYAMAETVFAVSQSDHTAQPRLVRIDLTALKQPDQQVLRTDADNGLDFVSNGVPIEGIEVRIDTKGGPVLVASGVNAQQAGEIQVRGSFVFDGYYRNPEQSAVAFTPDGWYRTGDIGFCDGGELFICGRTKELLIIHGKNFYVGDIEQIITTIDGVKPGRVVTFDVFDPQTDSDECVVMAETTITDTKEQRALKRDIKSQVAQKLSLQIRTVDLVAPGTLAKTTSGKMSRAENKTIWKAHHASS